jgi:hypothetical protein
MSHLFVVTLMLMVTVTLFGSTSKNTMLFFANAQQDDQKYYISKPSFSQAGITLSLEYSVSNILSNEHLGWTLWDGTSCGSSDVNTDITTNDYLSVTLTADDDTLPPPLEDGSSSSSSSSSSLVLRNVTVELTLNPDTIESSPILIKNSNGVTSQIQFCIRLGAYSADVINPGALEVYTRDTFVTINVQQDEDYDELQDVVIVPGADQTPLVQSQYYLMAYLCDAANQAITVLPSFLVYPEETVRVCITPNPEALAAGVYMRSIDTFSWTRASIYQPAIVQYQVNASLTTVDCSPGMTICTILTTFKYAFFYSVGKVQGSGVGWLQVCFNLIVGTVSILFANVWSLNHKIICTLFAMFSFSFFILSRPETQDVEQASFQEI